MITHAIRDLPSRRDTEYSLWAKDLVFVISDGYLDGMQAFITTYHGLPQASGSPPFQSVDVR